MALIARYNDHPLGPVIWAFDVIPTNLPAMGIQPGDYIFNGGLNLVTDGFKLVQVSGNNNAGTTWYVDGDNGNDSNSGLSWTSAFASISAAVAAAATGATILIRARAMAAGATDPVNYAETIMIPAGKSGLKLIGMAAGPAQGQLPQIKKGSGSTALLTIRSPGCYIANLGFNGGSSTGGGILLDDDGSTKSAFGTVIAGCHFKNCVNSGKADTGGAIQWAATGGAWQVRISGCRFYNNVADIVVIGTSDSVPQDVVIEDCDFSGPAAAVDTQIQIGGSGVAGIAIKRCNFPVLGTLSGASIKRMINAPSGTLGIISQCHFGTAAANAAAFGTSGAIAVIPATLFLTDCYVEGALATRT